MRVALSTCVDCGSSAYSIRCRPCYEKTRKRNLRELTCPDCGQTRHVNHRTYWASMQRAVPGRCRPCGIAHLWAESRSRTEKPCSACRVVKPLSAYHRSTTTRDGRGSVCVPCARERAREYARKNTDAAVARATRWARENPERRKQISSKHAKRFRMAHPERAKQRKDRTDFDAILEQHGMVCHICGESVREGDLHFDHVIPLSRGGAHSPDNIRPAHSRCNLRKGTKLIEEFAR